jgi:hypothetical protein
MISNLKPISCLRMRLKTKSNRKTKERKKNKGHASRFIWTMQPCNFNSILLMFLVTKGEIWHLITMTSSTMRKIVLHHLVWTSKLACAMLLRSKVIFYIEKERKCDHCQPPF